MIENNKPSYEELEASITHLSAQVNTASQRIEQLESRVTLVQGYADTAQEVINKAKRLIEESLSEAEEPMALYAEFKEAFEVLDVQVTEEVEVTITATWTVTVTKPMGYELSEDDFTAELDTANGDLEVDRIWRTPDITVEETGY